MEAIISACTTALFDRSLAVIGRQFGYLCNYRKNVGSLSDQVMRLDAKRADKSHSVTIAQRNAEKIRSQTSNWQKKADKISEDARKFIEQCEEERKKRCVMGLCPNPVSRYRFSRIACKKKMDIEEAMTEAEQILKDSDPAVGLGKEIALSTKGLFFFESRKSILEDIMEALQDETTKSIGVYGFGGMGKTTLAKQVAARADEDNMFEDIVFALVTQKVELKEIQEKIASMLDLKLKGSTEAEYAGLIYERLKGKKVLVVLDDLWKELDLNDVGIPFGTKHSGCKILLTSRYLQILSSMGTEKDFKLGALEEEEAWRLFEEKTGNILKNSDFCKIGKKVSKKCQGLPVLIVTVSASLSKRPQLPAWKDALNQLKKMNHKEMHDIVNSAIESISYNHLDKTHKQLFLLCGLIGGVASIEEMLEYSWGLDLFDKESVTIQEARDRLHTLIIDLKESCLLLDVNEGNSIKMHDVVRDVAISIGRKDSNMLSLGEHDAVFNICCKDDDLTDCTAMFLHGCPDLPLRLECPSLELFVMSGFFPYHSSSIPETFFEKTDKLKVLGMSKLSFSELPPSLSFLGNLQTLRVNDCYSLKDISVVGGLKKLQILKFVGSSIEELPFGIGQLTELRSLDVRGCSKLKVIPAGLIKGLTQLEELYVSLDFNRWEAEEFVDNNVKINASLQELKHLHNLCSLEIAVGDDKHLPKDLHFEKLERYEIIVGKRSYYNQGSFDVIGVTRKFSLHLNTTSINHLHHGVKVLVKITECLFLGELRGIENVTPALDGDGFPILKHLRIEYDYEIQYIVNVKDKQHIAAFPCLESLHLTDLWKLQKICNGPLMKESFCNLTIMNVTSCYVLKSLFSFSMATGLPRLQEIEVSYCDALEAIVAEKNMNDDTNGVCEEIVEFAQLRRLSLRGLPKLKNFFSNGEIQNKSQKSLQESEIYTEEEDETEAEEEEDETEAEEEEEEEEDETEEKLKSSLPFFTKVSFPKLEELKLSDISSLKYLLTPSVAMGLVGLKSLEVDNCEGMKHIIVAEEEGETNIETISFPQLRSLCLTCLPNLTSIYSEMGWNKNHTATATQPLFIEKVSFPKLEELELCAISNLTELWSHKIQEISCCKIRIWSCKSLKHVFPSSVGQSLNKLESLIVENCEVMETIIGDENREKEEIVKATQHEHVAPTFMFAKLTDVCLEWLPKMECFYPREHTIECPGLADIHVHECGKLNALDFLIFPEKQGDNLFEKVMSKSKDMSIRSIDLVKILRLYGHFPPHLFSNLERLNIVEFHRGSDVFPSEFLNIIHSKLETLRVCNCSFQEIFAYEGEVTNHANDDGDGDDDDDDDNDCKLANLELKKLPELKYICKHDQYSPIIRNILRKLEFIEVEECPRLTNLVPPSVSFRSLTGLILKDCGGLTNLIQPSTATTLERLQWLKISGCVMMEKVIGGDDEESSRDDNIKLFFTDLGRLELDKLPRLTNFCSSPNYTFNFPKLYTVTVRECPNMKTFCVGITTTPSLNVVEYEDDRQRWDGDLNTTVQKVFAKMEAKRLGTSLSSTSSESGEFQLSDPEVCDDFIESNKGTETCEEVIEEGKEGGIFVKATANDKGKGKEVEISEITRHSDPSTHKYTSPVRDMFMAGSFASSSKLSGHSEEFPRLTATLPSTSSNNQEAEIHEKEAEPTKEHQIFKHVVDDISEKGTFCEIAIEPRNGTEISEEMVEKGGKEVEICAKPTMEVHKLTPMFPSTSKTNHFEVAAETSLSLSTELEVQRSTPIVESETADPRKAGETWNHSDMESLARASSSIHFIPLLSEFLQIIQNQPLKSMSAEHVQFMENAFRDLSNMNFSIEWLNPYVQKARECLPVLESRREISELESEIAKMEAELEAVKEKKKALEEKYEGVASRIDLDKPLHDS